MHSLSPSITWFVPPCLPFGLSFDPCVLKRCASIGRFFSPQIRPASYVSLRRGHPLALGWASIALLQPWMVHRMISRWFWGPVLIPFPPRERRCCPSSTPPQRPLHVRSSETKNPARSPGFGLRFLPFASRTVPPATLRFDRDLSRKPSMHGRTSRYLRSCL